MEGNSLEFRNFHSYLYNSKMVEVRYDNDDDNTKRRNIDKFDEMKEKSRKKNLIIESEKLLDFI